ncbi:MAG TPA: hypothetical protein VK308_01680, partial [Pyrinomonadaceae bacterium]|nr:hypothetical protein [Pyrinomonadaceae bacterium]
LTIEPPDIMRIEDSVDFNAEIEPEAISVDQDSQSALIDDDMEDYEDDCEDDLEMSRGQKRVLSIF